MTDQPGGAPSLRERLLIALCIDHGHLSQQGSLDCRTCNRRVDTITRVLRKYDAECLSDGRGRAMTDEGRSRTDTEVIDLAREVVLSSHYMTASCGNEAVHRLRHALGLGRCGHHSADYGLTDDASSQEDQR